YQCLEDAVAASTCDATDYICQCTTEYDTITRSVTECILKSTCTAKELKRFDAGFVLEVQDFGATFCPSILSSAGKDSATRPPSSGAAATPASARASPTASSPATESMVNGFGAGTPGTTWGAAQQGVANENRGPGFEAASITLFCIAVFVVAFRFYARYKTKQLRQVARSFGADEWFALAATILSGGVMGTVIAGVKYGMGKHLAHQTPYELEHLVVYAFVLIVTEAFGALKLSILCLYLRMTPDRSHKRIVYSMMGLVAAHNIAALFSAAFSCKPVSEFWNIYSPVLNNPHCVNILVLDLFNGAWSVFEDVIIWLLPIPVVWKLKVPFSRKVGLYSLIAISFVAVLAAILRLNTTVIWIHSIDISWNFPLVPFFCSLECCVALITSSVPAIYPLFRRSTMEAAEKRRSQMLEQQMVEQNKAHEWDSQDDTLASSSGGRGMDRSRWSWLSWHGPVRARDKEGEMDVFGKELERVNEEDKVTEVPKRDVPPGTAV
ncbi:MAG: hypothetical protein Q9214_006478, partial [Letrouitia sp. 1 TL-2023]